MSEGDAGSFEAINKMNTSSSLDLSELQQGNHIMFCNDKDSNCSSSGWENESHEDSGMSSSYEEIIVTGGQHSNAVNNNVTSKPKSKRMTKKRSKQIQMANELIFDLDI